MKRNSDRLISGRRIKLKGFGAQNQQQQEKEKEEEEMNLALVSSPALPELHFLHRTFLSADYETLNLCRSRTRVSVTLRPFTCFASSSSSSPSSPAQEEVPAAATTRTSVTPLHRSEKPSSSSSSSSDLANFKPPLPDLPDNPKDLAADLPFQFWYSYADLPPGIPKRRAKNDLSPTSKSEGKRDGLDKGRAGGSGSLWEAVLAVEAESNLDVPKVSRRGRRGGAGGGLGEAETGLSSTDFEKRLEGQPAGTLQEDENTPLTEEETKKLIQSCHGTSRQINIGWEGWRENYVALVHSYWKRSRVCKIKCKGVVTLDMDFMCKVLEVETGGRVIGRVGGTVYLFRGWNFDYWRDAQRPTIKQPRILQRFPKRLPVPSNLKEDIKALRVRGRELPPLCKPGKHGVYLTLLQDVRKAFETQDLVRVNCQDFHSKNMKLLGFQLQELVPCELISFEFEHILMWRSKDGNSPNAEVVLNKSEDNHLVPEALS